MWRALLEALTLTQSFLTRRFGRHARIFVRSPEELAEMPEGSFDVVAMHSVAQYLRAEELDTALAVPRGGPGLEDVLAVDAALKRLETEHPRKAKVVIMRYFGGLSIEETAEAMGASVATVNRDWRLARSWLIREMRRASS